MTTATVQRNIPNAAGARDRHEHRPSVAGRVSGGMRFARAGARGLTERLPGTVDAALAGANDLTSALQRLPNTTLQWLAASSIGLGVGFYLSGAPRLIVAAGIAPALITGAAIAIRPIVPRRASTSTP